MRQKTIKWFRRISLVIVIIPFLLFLAFAGAVSLIDFNKYKPQIEQEFAELTERKVVIDGDINVSILPFVFHVDQVKVKNQPGFENPDMLSIKEIYIELSLAKLFFSRQLEIISLEVIEPEMYFVENAGQNNWQGIPLLSAIRPDSKELPFFNADNLRKVSSPDSVHIPDVVIRNEKEEWFLESLLIKNAQISYQNVTQDVAITLKRANLVTFDVRPNKPFKINSDFVYEHSQSPRVFDFEVNGHFSMANNFTQIFLNDWSGIFRLRLPEERNLPDIRMTTTGKSLLVDFSKQQLFIKDTHLNGMSSEVSTSFQGSFGVDPEFRGVFVAKQINIKDWLEHLGLPAPETQKPDALTKVGGKFDFFWDGKVLKLEQIDALIDESSIKGSLQIPTAYLMGKDLQGSSGLDFELLVKNLNLVDYKIKSSTDQYLYPFDITWLTQLHTEGILELENLGYGDKYLKKVSFELIADKGVVELAPLDVVFQQGQLLSKLKLVINNSNVEFYWKGQTEQLALSELTIEPMAIDGLLTSRYALQSSGSQMIDYWANLEGNVKANIEQASIQGLASVVNSFQGEVEKAKTTLPVELEVIGGLKKGVFVPKRLQFSGDGVSGSGLGHVNLAENSVEGQINLRLNADLKAAPEKNNIELPLKFSGSLDQPVWSIKKYF